MVQTLYFDPVLGNSNNSGSYSSPLLAPADLNAVGVQDGAIFYFAPGNYPQFVLNDRFYDSIQLLALPGQAPGTFRGDTLVPTGGWVADGGNRYHIALAAIPLVGTVGAVTCDADETLDANGSPTGELANVADAATVSATANSWSVVAGVLYVNTGDNAGTHRIRVTPLGQNVIDVKSNNSLFQVSGRYGVDPAGGYVFFGQGSHNIVEVGELVRGGKHIAGYAGPNQNLYNTIRPYSSMGTMRGMANAGSALVFYGENGDIYGNRAQGITVYAHTALKRDGTLLAPTDTCGGFITHTDGVAGHIVKDTEVVGATINYTKLQKGSPFDGGGSPGPVADVNSLASYPVRCISCKTVGATSNTSQGHIAFSQCDFDLTRSFNYDVAGAGRAFVGNGIAPVNIGIFGSRVKWSSGTDIGDGSTNGNVCLHGGGSGNQTVALNSTFHDVGTGLVVAFCNISGNDLLMRVRGSIITFNSANPYYIGARKVCMDGGALFAASKDLKDNFYFNVGGSQYGGSGFIGDWIDTQDQAGLFSKTLPYVNEAGGDLSISPLHPVYYMRKLLTTHALLGRSGEQYSGAYGCDQPQAPAKRPALFRAPRI